MGNTITADLNGRTSCITAPLWQYDYGQILKISGVELPDSYEVHFSDKRTGISTTMLGDDEGVQIPDMYLLSGRDVTAWVYLHTTDEDGETEYDITIPVKERAKPTYDEPTPVQQAFIEQAIAAMNAAVEKTDGNVEKYPRIIEGYWCVWDADDEQFVSTGVKAQGEPGFSPIANVTKTGNTATITITDESGTTTANVYDGDYENLIDDTAGAGVTNKAWSADKNVTMLAGKADKTDTVLTTTLSRGRDGSSTVGTGSFAFGNVVIASGNYSHAEGMYIFNPRNPSASRKTAATGDVSHAEGMGAVANGNYSHAEGQATETNGQASHAEGWSTHSNADAAHSENYFTTASGDYSHAENYYTEASGQSSHAEGTYTVANHQSQHAGGEYNIPDPSTAQATARGTYVEVIGNGTATNNRSNARTLDWDGNERLKGDLYINCNVDSTGGTSMTSALDGKADKADTVLTNTLSRGRKANTTVGYGSIAFGGNVTASASYSVAEGNSTTVTTTGSYSHAEGEGSTVSSPSSHAEGYNTNVAGQYGHAEGSQCVVTGQAGHAEGSSTQASNNAAHAEGQSTTASGAYGSHSEGYGTTASGQSAHSEGTGTTASGSASHAEGYYTTANHRSQHTGGEYNVLDTSTATASNRGNYAEIIGNGTSSSARSNARTLDWSGNERIMGDLYVGCNADSSGGTKVAKISDVTVTDVQVNGTSILSQGVANVPVASTNDFGVAKVNSTYGIHLQNSGTTLAIAGASSSGIKNGTNTYTPVVPVHQHESVYYGLAKLAGADMKNVSGETVGVYPEAQKKAIQTMIGVEPCVTLIEEVEGTTPSLTCEPNVRYVCGEVSTISITPPSSGTIDVYFTSGSTAAVMTVPNTVKFPVWFDSTALETDTVYEIMITDGVYGSVMVWAD